MIKIVIERAFCFLLIGGLLMKCPFCGHEEDRVIDSRPTDEGSSIRRRRECIKCEKRFTTYEKVESLPLMVIKKDKTRQVYSREKILNGLLRACEKRPVSADDLEKLVDEIESRIYNSLQKEITTQAIGEMVMAGLKNLDEVAYVRFASVYRQFKDINTFMEELKKLLDEK
jgi:transcriptional repressor NrdR